MGRLLSWKEKYENARAEAWLDLRLVSSEGGASYLLSVLYFCFWQISCFSPAGLNPDFDPNVDPPFFLPFSSLDSTPLVSSLIF